MARSGRLAHRPRVSAPCRWGRPARGPLGHAPTPPARGSPVASGASDAPGHTAPHRSVRGLILGMRFAVVALLVAAPAFSCVGAPSRFSSRSAASLEAVAAPQADVSRSMREDPPLPGAPVEGWVGLSTPLPAESMRGHAGHAGHGAMGAMPMDHAAMGHRSSPSAPGPAPGPPDAGASVGGAHDGH